MTIVRLTVIRLIYSDSDHNRDHSLSPNSSQSPNPSLQPRVLCCEVARNEIRVRVWVWVRIRIRLPTSEFLTVRWHVMKCWRMERKRVGTTTALVLGPNPNPNSMEGWDNYSFGTWPKSLKVTYPLNYYFTVPAFGICSPHFTSTWCRLKPRISLQLGVVWSHVLTLTRLNASSNPNLNRIIWIHVVSWCFYV